MSNVSESDIPEEFDNMPIEGPTVKAFIELLAKIAARAYREELEKNNDEKEKKLHWIEVSILKCKNYRKFFCPRQDFL